MKYCYNCGKEINNEATFCPHCGTKVSGNNASGNQNSNTNQNANPNMNQNNGNYRGVPGIELKNIATCVVLSIVTCGIYWIIWYIAMVDDVNRICNDDKSAQSGGTVFLLTLVTCGIYGIIWFYNCGQRMAIAGRSYGRNIEDNSTLYLVLSIVGLQLVAGAMLQGELNKFAS